MPLPNQNAPEPEGLNFIYNYSSASTVTAQRWICANRYVSGKAVAGNVMTIRSPSGEECFEVIYPFSSSS